MSGTLNLRCVRADLTKEASNASVYCAFHLGDHEAHSEVDKRGGKHPEWDELFHFDLTGTELILIARVFKSKHFTKDQMIGEGSLELHDLIRAEKFERWIELKNHSDFAGKVLIQSEFVPLVGGNPEIFQSTSEKKSTLETYKKKLFDGYNQNKLKLIEKYNSYIDQATREVNEENAKKLAKSQATTEVDVKTEVIPLEENVASSTVINSEGQAERVTVVPVAVVETAEVQGEGVAVREVTVVPVEVTEKIVESSESHGLGGRLQDLKDTVSSKIEEVKVNHEMSKLNKELAKGETVVVTDTEKNYIVPEMQHKEYKEPLDLMNMSDKSSPIKGRAAASVKTENEFPTAPANSEPFKFA